MDRIVISETLAARIGNSFLKNENSFQQAMKQRVFLERIFSHNLMNRIAISDSCLKNLEFFFVGMRILSGRQRSKRFFWKECLIADPMTRIAISEFIR